ncbi:MAG: O-antigen ligase family protein [Pigmentiphaga sp.]|nr:O-antigen ligase family protein [Pigmentiphaga sp.]
MMPFSSSTRPGATSADRDGAGQHPSARAPRHSQDGGIVRHRSTAAGPLFVDPPPTWTAAQWLAVVGACGLPLLALTTRGGANTAYFVVLLSAVLGALTLGVARATDRTLPSLRPFWRPAWPLAVALGTPLAAVLWSQWLTGTWSGRPYDGMSRLMLAAPIAWWLCQVPERRLRLWAWACMAGAVLATWILWQSIPPWDTRPEPPYATAITFGNLCLLLGVFSALSLGWRLTRWRGEVVIKALAAGIGLYGSFLSQSRGGWLALPVIIGVLVLILNISWRRRAGVALLTIAGLGAAYVASPMVQDRVVLAVSELRDFQRGENLESSIGMRMQFWQASWEMFRDHPLTGVGSQNINAEFRERVAQGRMAELGATHNHSHNEVLWFMASWGAPGLLALLAVYLAPWWAFVRAARSADPDRATAGRLGVALVTGYASFGLTEAMFAITMNVAFYAGHVAILLALALPRRPAIAGGSS